MFLSTYILCLFVSVIVVEALTELAIKSEIFKPLRDKIKGLNEWLGKLFSCGYCFSVWAAAAVVLLLNLSYNFANWHWVNLGISILVVHRGSNVLHNCIDKHTDKYYDVRYINTEHED